MKVTGGKYRGRTIEARPDRGMRPTSSRIREVIFNLILHGKFQKNDDFIWDDNPSLIEDRRVVDIFCGTGALSIEALSRGAAHVTLIDQNPKMIGLAEHNVKHIGEKEHATFFRSDSTQLPRAVEPCHLAFVDPPYKQKLMTPALKSLVANGWLAHGALVIAEEGKQDSFEVPEGFKLLDNRVHDATRINVLQYINGKEV